MKPYSNDLRGKIIAAYENTESSQREVATLFGVAPATVRNLVRRQRETGSADALPHAGGKAPSLDGPARTFVQTVVRHHHDLTLKELVQWVEHEHRTKVSLSTMCRVLQALGLPRKKSRSMPQNGTPPESSTPAERTSTSSARSR